MNDLFSFFNSCTSLTPNVEEAQENKDRAYDIRVLAESFREIFDGTVSKSIDEKVEYLKNLNNVCSSLKY